MKKMYNIIIYDNGGKTADRYTVIINNDVYAMSYYPNRVNEVCSYWGSVEEFKKFNGRRLKYIPKNLRYQINQLIKEDVRGKISSYLYGELYNKMKHLNDGEIEELADIYSVHIIDVIE